MNQPVTLCLDFGNTRQKAAVFQHDELIATEVLGENHVTDIEQLLAKYNPQFSILSSVIHHDEQVDALLNARTQFHRVSAKTKIPFTVPIAKPETIGADRIALIAAAVHFFPGKNNLVIAMGSCITYNFVNKEHIFLGGSISPGKLMRFKAMHQFTAKLPMTDAEFSPPLIGYDTLTNLQSGVIWGMVSEMDGIIEKYNAKFGNFNVVLTGGDTAYFATQLKREIFADFNFLFKGLYALSLLNNKMS